MPCVCPMCGRSVDCDVMICDVCVIEPIGDNGASVVIVRRLNGREEEEKEIEVS